jgi:dTDP-4-amino-4,6-dideoxygalactose transaminase
VPEPEFIPFNLPFIERSEIEAVEGVLKSGWLTTGPVATRFEAAFRNYVQARHALAVNSATAGLHLALKALGLGPGDEVITTPLTFCATFNAILQVGATPVLADIDSTLNISPESVSDLITRRTRAILPVHFAGLPCDMDKLWRIASDHHLMIVEDAAHAAGSWWNGAPIGGGQSDAVVFSFYPTKNMTTGEGGMVTTSSDELNESMRTLCLHGMSRQAWSRYSGTGSWAYEVVACGFKYNLSDIAAALGLAQLARLDRMTERRREIARRYSEALGGIPELELPPAGSGHCWHLYVLRLNLEKLSIDRAEFIEEMRKRGIGCSVHFIPIPLHPYYRHAIEMRDRCERTMREYPRLLSLPLYPRLGEEQVDRVVSAVLDIVWKHKVKLRRTASAPARELASTLRTRLRAAERRPRTAKRAAQPRGDESASPRAAGASGPLTSAAGEAR